MCQLNSPDKKSKTRGDKQRRIIKAYAKNQNLMVSLKDWWENSKVKLRNNLKPFTKRIAKTKVLIQISRKSFTKEPFKLHAICTIKTETFSTYWHMVKKIDKLNLELEGKRCQM